MIFHKHYLTYLAGDKVFAKLWWKGRAFLVTFPRPATCSDQLRGPLAGLAPNTAANKWCCLYLV